MVRRQHWLTRLDRAWLERSVVWLMGVRRVGKTVLAQSVPDADYFDCELPSVRRQLEDVEAFLSARPNRTVVLDEIHRLPDASQVLKIAADHFPATRVLATGSSTLGASARFRDTLSGRKREVWLTPMVAADLESFGVRDIDHRLLRGGLPPFVLAERLPQHDFQEWMDAYWARDILELFRLERRQAFQKLFELLLAQSGGIFEAASLARACEISRPTVANYVSVLEATFAVHVVRPYAAGGSAEIVSAPRIYGFDTGFVCHQRGWHELRSDDRGVLWEHLVLNEMQAHAGREPIRYWRSKHGNEVDFVFVQRGRAPAVVECKWSADAFDAAGLRAFRRRYPEGENWVVAQDVRQAYTRSVGSSQVRFVPIQDVSRLVHAGDSPSAQSS